MATFVCPACWRVTEVPDDMAGRQVRCPDCHAIGPAQPKSAPAAAPSPSPTPDEGPATAAPPSPPRPPAARESPNRPPVDTRQVVIVAAWSACLVWTLGVMLKYGWLMDTAESVVQQSAFGVRAGAWILGGYVIARAVHALADARRRS